MALYSSMKFLPLTNLGRQLCPEYRRATTILCLSGIVVSCIPTGLFAIRSAHALRLQDHAPLVGQENGVLWFFLFLTFAITSMIIGYLGSFVVLAGILRWFYGCTPTRIHELIFESRIPPHWFKHYRRN